MSTTVIANTGGFGSGRTRALATPLASAATALTAVGWVGTVSPYEAGHYPGCFFLAATGLQCPGCGTLRAVHELAHGDLMAAIDLNAVTTALMFTAVAAWVVWVRTRLGLRAGPNRLLIATATTLALALPVFAVLRNLEPFSFLAP